MGVVSSPWVCVPQVKALPRGDPQTLCSTWARTSPPPSTSCPPALAGAPQSPTIAKHFTFYAPCPCWMIAEHELQSPIPSPPHRQPLPTGSQGFPFLTLGWAHRTALATPWSKSPLFQNLGFSSCPIKLSLPTADWTTEKAHDEPPVSSNSVLHVPDTQTPKATAHWRLAAPWSQEGNTALSSLPETGDHLAPGSGLDLVPLGSPRAWALPEACRQHAWWSPQTG